MELFFHVIKHLLFHCLPNVFLPSYLNSHYLLSICPQRVRTHCSTTNLSNFLHFLNQCGHRLRSCKIRLLCLFRDTQLIQTIQTPSRDPEHTDITSLVPDIIILYSTLSSIPGLGRPGPLGDIPENNGETHISPGIVSKLVFMY